MIAAHLVKTEKGKRRGQIIHLQFYKLTSSIHADLSSISSVSQQEVRQTEQHAQLFPLPPWSPKLLRQQLGEISHLGLSSFQGVSGSLAHSPFFHCTLGGAALCSNFFLSFSRLNGLLMLVFRRYVQLLHLKNCTKRYCHAPTDSNCNCCDTSHGFSETEVDSPTLEWGGWQTLYSWVPVENIILTLLSPVGVKSSAQC